jgi:hypothetical protein
MSTHHQADPEGASQPVTLGDLPAADNVLSQAVISPKPGEDAGSTLARERLELGARCKSLAAKLISASMAAGDDAAWKPIADELATAIDQLAEMPPQPVVAWVVLTDAGEISHITHNTLQRDAAMAHGMRLVPLALAAPCLTPFTALHRFDSPQSPRS